MYKACIFDMDGTVCDTLASIAHFANRALERYNMPAIPTERYKILVGNGSHTLIERMIAEVGGDPSVTEEMHKGYVREQQQNFLYLTKPYDGVIEMLDRLNAAGVKCAILSNKPEPAAKAISDALFGDRIAVCRGGRDSVPLKPDITAAMEIIRELDVGADECLYAGDTATDMLTGKNAGFFTVGVLWGFRDRAELEASGADAIVSSPDMITRLALG